MLENIRLSLRGIKTHKLRSFLTMLGVIIGIASIIAIVSIVHGTNAKLEKSLIGSGNNVTTVALSKDGYEYDLSYSSLPDGVPVIGEDTMEEIRALDGVEAASAYRARDGWDEVSYAGVGMGSGRVLGVDGEFFETIQYQFTKGRNFSEEELSKGMKVAVLDRNACEKLFEGEDPVGKAVEIKGEPFVVVGVVKDRNAQDTEYESLSDYYTYAYDSTKTNVYIPSEAWPIIYRFDEPQNVAVRAAETRMMASLGREAADILNMNVSSSTYAYSSLSSSEDMNDLKTLTNAIQLMLVSIASLSLLVGGIGVMNIMLVSVTERTSEIGLKKALGAKHRTILAQFLTESAVLTSVGGLIGILVGIGLAKIISWVASLEFGISVPWILISVLFSIFIGIVFGAMPASRAAKLSPIDALRRE